MGTADAAGSVPSSMRCTYIGVSVCRILCDCDEDVAGRPYAAFQSLADVCSTRPLSHSASSRK
jgi:hypothetical protein